MDECNSYQLFEMRGGRAVLTLHREENREPMQCCHCHQQMEILLVLEGKGAVKINGDTTLDAESGDILVFDSMQLHQLYHVDKKSPFSTLSIVFDVRGFITEEYKVFDPEDLDRLFIKLYNSECLIVKESKCAEKLKHILLQMEEELKLEKGGSHHVVRAQMLLIYALLLQYYDEIYDASRLKKTNRNTAIEKTMVYINQHLADDLTLEELAKIANMNKTYYSTVFKKITGITVWEYILKMRVELAISYLVMNKSKYNISEISEMCGFHNAANFNKVFKRITGKTPSEYKKTKYNSCFFE